MKIVDALEYPNFDYSTLDPEEIPADSSEPVQLGPGQYARYWCTERDVVMARDPLGCNKLFYGFNRKGELVMASRIRRALTLGVHLDNLASCPPGHVVRISADGQIRTVGQELSSRRIKKEFDMEVFRRKVAGTLIEAINRVKAEFPDATFVVCLSGGLDSSVIASLAAGFLNNVVAVSFSYVSHGDALSWLNGKNWKDLDSVSEDFLCACEVAQALGIPLYPVLRTPDMVLSAVIPAVTLCQDWRDFNVHCAVVNFFLAQDLRVLFPNGNVVILTGDLMNEFVCDYHEEIVAGTVYYPQPRLPLESRRRFFVRGLDTSDREIGVFAAFGLPLCQLFATLAAYYLEVPGELLSKPDIKKELNGHLLADTVKDKVNKTKRRAQVGGKDGGTLGIFHRLALGQRRLEKLWIESLPETMRGQNSLEIIEFGRYRTSPRGG